jgi:hypothetical protein
VEEAIMMARPTFEQTIQRFLRRKPFKPFVIEFDNGQRWVVEKPEVLFHHTGDSALYFRPDGSFDFVDCDNVRQIIELTPAASP